MTACLSDKNNIQLTRTPSLRIAGLLAGVMLSVLPVQGFADETTRQAAVPEMINYGKHEAVAGFIDRMVEQHGFDRPYLQGLFDDASKQQSIIDAISRPAEKMLTWGEYRKIFLTEKRISGGKKFMEEHKDTLERAEKEFGVPKEIIAAIIGVETSYGQIMGRYRVVDALSTLSFDYPARSKFFSKELEELLLLSREQKFDPMALKGSYAGAMGYGQFIPSSYRAYAVDFDGDDTADILNNVEDAIGSVANYFKRHGWKTDEPVAFPVDVKEPVPAELLPENRKPAQKLADVAKVGVKAPDSIAKDAPVRLVRYENTDAIEHWLVTHNFYVITRYNHSDRYAMAVYQLSRELAGA
ncbi:lytic murein transglycosylase B [Allohahella marinimesophila]|uniref:Lytic murein transglycosylase B n=1 Tax=Allohahella marinimesophila TaxID=1054972 RepID=A0ABP7NII5_9GAMM